MRSPWEMVARYILRRALWICGAFFKILCAGGVERVPPLVQGRRRRAAWYCSPRVTNRKNVGLP